MFKNVMDMSSAMKSEDREGAEGVDEGEEKDGQEGEEEEEDFDAEVGAFMEAELLEKIATKLTLLTDITVQRNMTDEVDETLQAYTHTAVTHAKRDVVREEEEEPRDEE